MATGTSTGAIIGTCLALGMRVRDVASFYEESGPAMFDQAGLIERFRSGKFHDKKLAAKRKELTNKALLSTEELRDVVGTAEQTLFERLKGAVGKRVVRSRDIFTVAVKPFMDKHTYDQDRIATCCHHLIQDGGFNAMRQHRRRNTR